VHVNVFLYADDIIYVLAPSIDALMRLLRLVEDELAFLDMAQANLFVFVMVCALTVIAVKSARMTVTVCAGLACTCRYLGVFLVASRKSHRENSKFLWTITKNLFIDHLMLFSGKLAV